MSTQCTIQFEGLSGVRLFQHWDGYPQGEHGMLAKLVPLVRRFYDVRGHEPDLLAAYLLRQLSKDHHSDMLGFRIFTVAADVDYEYRVTKHGTLQYRPYGDRKWRLA